MGVDGWEVDPEDAWRDIPVGLCTHMAPLFEISERERSGRLHYFEMKEGSMPPKADHDLVVKEFIRSCVGNDIQRPGSLRPFPVLMKTMEHLLHNICTLKEDWIKISDFVYNRLCSVRQDMIVQRIHGKPAIAILEGCCRFLVYSSYKLTNTCLNFTDVKIRRKMPRKEYAAEAAKELSVISEIQLTDRCLCDCLASLLYQYKEFEPSSPNRVIYECLHLIRNTQMGKDMIGLTETGKVPDHIRESKLYKQVYDMTINHFVGNHHTALKQVDSLKDEPILLLAYAPLLAKYQIIMFDYLKRACRNTKCPPHIIANIICPHWLEKDESRKIRFTINFASQFDMYNEDHDSIEFGAPQPSYKKPDEVNPVSQVLNLSRDWPVFRESLTDIELSYFLLPRN